MRPYSRPLAAALGAAALSLRLAAAGPYTYSTLAGLVAGPGYVDGAGSAARFNGLACAATDRFGNLYIADTGNNAIRMVTPAGVVTTLAGAADGSPGSTDGTGSAARFHAPQALAVDAQGNVYVGDSGNFTVRKITVSGGVGTVTTLAGVVGVDNVINGTDPTTVEFDQISGLAVDPAGDTLYVVESDADDIREIAIGGGGIAVSTLVGLTSNPGSADGDASTAQFQAPQAVAWAGPGLLYVADTGNDTIRRISISGGSVAVTTVAGTAGTSGAVDGAAAAALFDGPEGVAVDGSGDVYVADTGNDTIREIAGPGGANPTVSTIGGSAGIPLYVDGPAAASRFNGPEGIAVDPAGDIYVADTGNSLLRKVAGGEVTTFAGATGKGANDGTGSAARFGEPVGMAVDGHGNVYVVDSTNELIREVSPTGTVTTLAGAPGVAGNADGPGSAARFNSPIGIAVDAAGDTAYVADAGNQRVRMLSIAGGSVTVTTLPARFAAPYGVALDASGDLFVTDTSADEVIEVTNGAATVLAGAYYSAYEYDGAGGNARFNTPVGIASNPAGTVLYVADQGGYTLRRVAVSGGVGTVTTVATYQGAVWGVAMDAAGDVFYTDPFLNQVREFDTGGNVSVVGGSIAFASGDADGVGSAATFHLPLGVAVDAAGNLYIADSENGLIRKGEPSQPQPAAAAPAFTSQPQSEDVPAGTTVSFVASASGSPAPSYQWYYDGVPLGGATGPVYTMLAVQLADAGDYYVVASNSQGSVTSQTATLGVVVPPVITSGGQASATVGGSFGYQLQATGNPTSYSLVGVLPSGLAFSAATGAITGTPTEAGVYPVQLTATNMVGSNSLTLTLTVDPAATPVNFSLRAVAGAAGQDVIAGWVVAGAGNGSAVVRAVGPTLAEFGVPNVLPDPALAVFDGHGALLASNSGWGGSAALANAFAAVGAFPLPANSKDAATLVPLAPGSYTAQASGASGDSGEVLLEVYDGAGAVSPSRIVNFSGMARVTPGAGGMTAGFVLAGASTESVLIRAAGPALSAFGLPDALAAPSLKLFDGSGLLVAANTGWSTAPAPGPSPLAAGAQSATAGVMAAAGAFPYAPGSADCAMLVTLPPGNYSAQVNGINGAAGTTLFEVYELGP